MLGFLGRTTNTCLTIWRCVRVTLLVCPRKPAAFDWRILYTPARLGLARNLAKGGRVCFWRFPKDYFDPGNRVYAYALRLIWPDVLDRRNWNNGTCGDIVEALLGYAFLNPHSVPAKRLAEFFDVLCYSVFQLLLHGPSCNWYLFDQFRTFSAPRTVVV